MYADEMTGSMQRAIGETDRRRAVQQKYNEEHRIVPRTIVKEVAETIAHDHGQGKARVRRTRR